MGAGRGLVLRAQVKALHWQRLCFMGAGRGLAPHTHMLSPQSNGDVDLDNIAVFIIGRAMVLLGTFCIIEQMAPDEERRGPCEGLKSEAEAH